MRSKKLFPSWWVAVIFLLTAVSGMGVWLFTDLPSVSALPARLNSPSVRITDRNGKILYEILPDEGGRHSVVPFDQIPLALRQATIATEDQDFYQHGGVDFEGVLRAIWINLQGGEAIAGGSTITQQVARNLLMDSGERSQRSLRRKLREWILAAQLTRNYSKDEILGLYLNQTNYGALAYGAEAAAQTYFGQPVSQLDLAEIAMLAGLPQAPALYNPYTDWEAAKKRQLVVLRLMEEAGFINSEERQLAEAEKLALAETPYPIEAPHFVMMVRSELDRLFSQEEVYAQGGLVVRTTLDLDWQKHAEQAVRRQIEKLHHSPDGLGHNVNSAALVALDPQNGDILSLVGSPDFFDKNIAGAINMALAPRQPGSALKPILYAAAMDPARGRGAWTAATMLLDVRTSFTTYDGKAYTPENYDQREHGPVLLRQALGSSLNIPAVITLDHIGLGELFNLAKQLGISTFSNPESYDLSLALGGGEVRLLELTAAYGVFANGGIRVVPVTILEVSNFKEEILYIDRGAPKMRVLDEKVAWLISDILSDNEARLTGFGANSILRLGRPAAVKTGTTSNFHDNWTVGYTPGLVVGVWSGNTNYEPMREVNGLTGAAPIWHQFMRVVLTNQPEEAFMQPPGFSRVEICALSGMLPSEACPYRRLEWFINGTEPATTDRFYRFVMVDSATGRLADEKTPPERRQERLALDLPELAIPWARSQGLLIYRDLLLQGGEVNLVTTPGTNIPLLRLVSPAQGSIFHLSRIASQESQRILIEAFGPAKMLEVNIYLDGQRLAQLSSPPYQVWWTLVAGTHRAWVECILENGEKLTSPVVTFEVIQ